MNTLNLLILFIFIDHSLQVRISDTSRHSSAALLLLYCCFTAGAYQRYKSPFVWLRSVLYCCFTAAYCFFTAALLQAHIRDTSRLSSGFEVATLKPMLVIILLN
jgi:hypothetical protein